MSLVRVFEAVRSNDLNFLKDFIEKESQNINECDEDGTTCLHIAAGLNDTTILEYLLKNGAFVDSVTSDGLTPLHIAAIWGKSDIVQVLINYGANIYQKDNNHYDAEMYAVMQSNELCVDFITNYITSVSLSNTKSSPESSDKNLEAFVTACSSPDSTTPKKVELDLDRLNGSPWITPRKRRERLKDKVRKDTCKCTTNEEVSMQCPTEEVPVTVSNMSNDFYSSSIDEYKEFLTEMSSGLLTTSNSDESNSTSFSYSTFIVSKATDNHPQDPTHFFVPFQNNAHPSNSIPETKPRAQHPPSPLRQPPKEMTDDTLIYDWKECSVVNDGKDEPVISIPMTYQSLTLEDIRKRIIALGQIPGPVTPATKQLYIKKLYKLENGLGNKDTKTNSAISSYPPELRMILTGRSSIPNCSNLEDEMMKEFSSKKAQWRAGCEKSSFNYLLLDPRVSCNLPNRIGKDLSDTEAFRCFSLSIFYVGKGKRARPYTHLHEAIKNVKTNKKLAQIWDIWDASLGVISLHIFQNTIPVEAFTREAHMIEALGLSQLTNQKRGEYYGLCSSLPLRTKRNIGIYFLNKAFKILLQEGERQICKDDL